MSPSFLHLEDIQNKTFMNKLWNGNAFVHSYEEILPILHDFTVIFMMRILSPHCP